MIRTNKVSLEEAQNFSIMPNWDKIHIITKLLVFTEGFVKYHTIGVDGDRESSA